LRKKNALRITIRAQCYVHGSGRTVARRTIELIIELTVNAVAYNVFAIPI